MPQPPRRGGWAPKRPRASGGFSSYFAGCPGQCQPLSPDFQANPTGRGLIRRPTPETPASPPWRTTPAASVITLCGVPTGWLTPTRFRPGYCCSTAFSCSITRAGGPARKAPDSTAPWMVGRPAWGARRGSPMSRICSSDSRRGQAQRAKHFQIFLKETLRLVHRLLHGGRQMEMEADADVFARAAGFRGRREASHRGSRRLHCPSRRPRPRRRR